MKFRVGSGTDIHRLAVNRKLVIGGVEIPSEKGFVAHSDGDILVHALCDALLGAAGLMDIGTYFPDTDDQYKSIDSLNGLLPRVRDMVYKNWKINNLDINIIIEKPKLGPYIEKIKTNLGSVLEISTDLISIKAKRTEGVIFIPPDEAAMALITVLLLKKD